MPADDRTRSSTTPPPRPRSLDECFDRLQALETRILVYQERIDHRLNAGASTMAELKSAVSDMRPRRVNLLSYAGLGLALAGIVFAAGRYPDRTVLDAMHENLMGEINKAAGQRDAVERELIRLRAELDLMKTNESEIRDRFSKILERCSSSRR